MINSSKWCANFRVDHESISLKNNKFLTHNGWFLSGSSLCKTAKKLRTKINFFSNVAFCPEMTFLKCYQGRQYIPVWCLIQKFQISSDSKTVSRFGICTTLRAKNSPTSFFKSSGLPRYNELGARDKKKSINRFGFWLNSWTLTNPEWN